MNQPPDARIEAALAGLADVRKIFLRDLVVDCSIGVHPHEKAVRQRVALNLDLYLRPHPPAQDDIGRVLDYDRVRDAIHAYIDGGHINLQETLVERVAALCFEFDEVIAVRVSTAKLDVYADAGAVGYELFRVRPPSRHWRDNT